MLERWPLGAGPQRVDRDIATEPKACTNGLTDPMSSLIAFLSLRTHTDLMLATASKLFSPPGWTYEISTTASGACESKRGRSTHYSWMAKATSLAHEHPPGHS
jgi:hypothetical protein